MKSVLIMSKTEKSFDPLIELMKSEGYNEFVTACTTQEAKNFIAKRVFDIILINTPIFDGGGIDLSVELCEHTQSGVFVLMKPDVYEKCVDIVESKGVFPMQKPLNRTAFHQCLRVWEISKMRLGSLEQENTKLKLQVEEMKVINRAKCTLMQCLMMSEKQAHRYIEKQAMDMRISKLQVAQRVLSTYEL